MARWSITGLWRGRYAYEPGEGVPQPPPPVAFTAELTQSWFGKFSGQVQDDPRQGVPEPAAVTGRVSGMLVTFSKWPAVFYVQGPGGRVPFREYLLSQAGLGLDDELASPPIYYRGRYDPDADRVEGDWEIRAEVLHFTSAGRTLECPVPAAAGTWEMARLNR